MIKLIRNIVFSALLLMPFYSMAQYGPMGIGNKDGSDGQPKLLLWLACDSMDVSGDNVNTWYDKSGNEHNFTALGTNRPSYQSTGGPSGKPSVHFDGIDDRMGFSGFPLAGNGYTIYFVYKSSDAKFGIFSYGNSTQPQEVLIHYDNQFYQKHGAGQLARTSLGTADGTWNYGGLVWSRASPTSGSQYSRTTDSETAAAGLTVAIPGSSGDAIIGDIQHAGGIFESGDAFEGDIAEIIIFEGAIKSGHTRLMRTYLWTKYGEAPEWKYTSNTGWDKFKGFATGSNAMYNEVIGIGKYSSTISGGQPESRLKGLVLRTSPSFGAYDNAAYMCAGLVPDAGNGIVATDLPTGVMGRWKRIWEIASTAAGSSEMLLSFDFGEGISGDIPQNAENFVLLRRANNSGTFQVVSGVQEQYVLDDEVVFRINQSGFAWSSSNKWHYTIGTTNTAQSTLDGAPIRTWYCRGTSQTAHLWSDPSKWTLDGSTNPIYINPNGEIPQPGDNVVIGSGKAIKIDIDDLNGISRLTVNGILNVDIASTPEFGAIAGNGTIRCAGHNGVGNFPRGNTTEFADPATGGTVEFYSTALGGGYTQTTASSSDVILVNNLIINMNQTPHEITLAANLTHNGTFNLTKGTLIINDGANLSRTITSNGRVSVSTNGIIKVCPDVVNGGSWHVTNNPNPNGKHRWLFNDDLYNIGQLIFTNRIVADYDNNESQHWIEAHFTNGVKNQLLTANGPENRFSRIIVNKGIDNTYVLTLSSNGADKFQLFGRHVTTDSPTPVVPNIQDTNGDRNSCVIINGTLEVTNNIFIPLHAIGGNYSIGDKAMLWVNGGTVTKGEPIGETNQAIVVYGKVRVTAGVLNANCRSGLTIRDNGVIQVDGGTVNANQIRTSVNGPENIGGVIINGGNVIVDGTSPGSLEGVYYTFSLTYPGNLFQMTGGVLRVKGPSGKGLIFINSDPQNTSVSGGTVIVEVATTADNHRISSRAAFWNLQIERTNTSTGNNNRAVKIQGGNSGSGGSGDANQVMAPQPLVVKGNLTIKGDNNPTLNTLVSTGVFADLHIQGNLTIQNGGIYLHHQNTTFFEGNSNSNLLLPTTATQTFYNVVVNKSSETRYAKITGGNTTRAMEVQGLFDIQNGYFDNSTRHVSIKGNLINRSFMGDPLGGSTGVIVFEGGSGQSMTSFNGVFHNLNIDNTAGVKLLNDGISVRRSLNLVNGNFFIDSYKVKIEGANGALAGSAFSAAKCIVTNGQPSAGGLELIFKSDAQNSTFPIGVRKGVGVKYTPAQIRINSGFVDEGYIRVIPVDTLLAMVDVSAGNPYLDYYWRVLQSEFDAFPLVSHMFQYDDLDVIGNEDSLASGRVLTESPFTRSVDSLAFHNDHVSIANKRIYYNAISDGVITNLTGTGTALVNADYSAGNRLRFEGRPKVYYSKSSVFNAAWDDPANWNELYDFEDDPYVLHSSGYNTPTGYPTAGDIAYIGFDPATGRPHVYGAPTTGGITASRVNFTYLQDASGNRLPRYYASGDTIESVLTLRPSLRFSTTAQIEKILEISGEGSLILAGSNIDLSKVDIGGFLDEDSSIVVLEKVSSMTSFPDNVPNLFIAAGSSSATQIHSEIEVRGNLEIVGSVGLYVSPAVAGDILVNGDLILDRYQLGTSSPSIRFANSGYKRTFVVKGDVFIRGNGARIFVNGANTSFPALSHDFIVWKNIFQDSNGSDNGLKFFTSTTTQIPHNQRINLILRGEGNQQFVKASGADPSLGRIVVDKGINTNSSFSFNSFISVNGETSGAEKPIELLNGKLVLNDPGIDITLSSLGSFLIPVEAGINLENGTLRVNGSNTGILLAGSLEVNGGLFEIGNSNENNFIEYAPSVVSKLYINGGTLSVGSQIRTDLTTGNGNLDYRQTGGEVIVARYSAPITTPIRPLFEVKGNLGSRFNHTGGTITFVRGLNHPSGNSLHIAPQFNSIGGDAKIIIGNSESPIGGQIKNFGVYSSIALNKLFLDNTSGNGPEARLVSPGLTLLDTLSIATGTKLTAGNFPVYLNGDFYNGGEIVSNGVLTLNHSSLKKVWGAGVFGLYDLVRTGGPAGLTLVESNLNVTRKFTCDSGEMDFGTNSISVKGNVILDGHLSFDSGSGLVLNGTGTGTQTLDRTGPGISEIDVLTIDNGNGNGVRMAPGAGYEFFISKEILLSKGVLGLQGNLLSIGESGIITPLKPFSSGNMISTYGSNSNYGVKKYFPAAFSQEFTLPLGVSSGVNKYTPVKFWFDQDDNTGSTASNYLITLSPSYHEIIDLPSREDSVLSMYFTLDANTLSADVRMNVDFQYDQSFVPVSPLESDYIAARVYSIGTVDYVNKILGPDAVDEVNNIIPYRFDGVGAVAIDGDYFAGMETAIPGTIPTYNTDQSGDVADDTYMESVPGGGAPNGARVNIRSSDTLTFDINSISFYRTDISEDAVLQIAATNFHRLGKVTGTGTIKLVGLGDLPSGNYQDFFTCGGGKLIYEGRNGDDFQILANQPNVRKVDVIGHPGSILTIANNNVSICEDFTIDGPTVRGANNMLLTVDNDVIVNSGTYDLGTSNIKINRNLEVDGTGSVTSYNSGTTKVEGNLLLNGSSFGLGEQNRSTQVKGNIIRTSGTILGGDGGATLSLNGSSPQSISGDFTGTSKIPTIEFDNSAGIHLLGNVEIRDSLKLSSGLINTTFDGLLILVNDGVEIVPIGGSSNSYVNGPMRWVLADNSAPSAPSRRVFPIGYGGRYRPVNLPYRSATTWEVQYYDTIALFQDPIISSLDLEDPAIETISVQEHWRIKGIASGATARVGLSWGENSVVSHEPGDYQNLVVLEYNTTNNNWESRGADNSSFAYSQVLDEGSFTAEVSSSFSEKFFTLGSTQSINPLPVTWLYFRGENKGEEHLLEWATSTEKDNDYFELERSIDAQNWLPVARITGAGYSTTQSNYSYTDRDAPYGRVYYRIRQVDFDRKSDINPNLVSLERALKSNSEKLEFVVYPNPTKYQTVRMMLPGYEDTAVSIMISDLSGKVLSNQIIQIDGQGISQQIDCNFNAGIYLVTVIVGDKIRSKPFVISK